MVNDQMAHSFTYDFKKITNIFSLPFQCVKNCNFWLILEILKYRDLQTNPGTNTRPGRGVCLYL